MPFLPVYKLGPIRILITFIGVGLAFIFTMFPFPVTSRDILRADVARLFQLLSKIYSVTQARLSSAVNFDKAKNTEALKKIISRVELKYLALQARCAENLMFASWEPNIQYKFPKEVYSDLLESIQR